MKRVSFAANFAAWRAAARHHLAAGEAPATLHFQGEGEPQGSLWNSRAKKSPEAPQNIDARATAPTPNPHPPRAPKNLEAPEASEARAAAPTPNPHPPRAPKNPEAPEAPDARAAAPTPNPHPTAPPHVPKPYLTLARDVAAHSDPARWDLLYRLLWRLTHNEPHLLAVSVDPDVALAQRLAHAVRRDVHKMHAFVRFVAVPAGDGEGERWVAWHRPDHHVLELAAPHFVRRFGAMPWSILTPTAAAHWDGAQLRYAAGCAQREAPAADAMEALWSTYYRSIFNPARLKVRAMRQEMPRRYWASMPETRQIDDLVASAPQRVQQLIAAQPASAADYLPQDPSSHAALRAAASACKACPWAAASTGTVFGEGPPAAPLALVGEQPGDMEDRAGRPFVGPAGELLARALADAAIDRGAAYVTNAVKHFKFELRGKRRIHQKPLARDLAACRPWLAAEMQALRPQVLVCLGVSAAQSVLGRAVRLRDVRGTLRATAWCPRTLCTIHPSAILRAPDSAQQDADYAALVTDLRAAAAQLAAPPPSA